MSIMLEEQEQFKFAMMVEFHPGQKTKKAK